MCSQSLFAPRRTNLRALCQIQPPYKEIGVTVLFGLSRAITSLIRILTKIVLKCRLSVLCTVLMSKFIHAIVVEEVVYTLAYKKGTNLVLFALNNDQEVYTDFNFAELIFKFELPVSCTSFIPSCASQQVNQKPNVDMAFGIPGLIIRVNDVVYILDDDMCNGHGAGIPQMDGTDLLFFIFFLIEEGLLTALARQPIITVPPVKCTPLSLSFFSAIFLSCKFL